MCICGHPKADHTMTGNCKAVKGVGDHCYMCECKDYKEDKQ
jgi:hypothetical protein